MKLYNCTTREEKNLKEIELQGLDKTELKDLSETIKRGYDNRTFEDENIVIDALHQIIEELIWR